MATFNSNANANFLLNTLKQTLIHGNPTSGTSIILTTGDGIVGDDSTGGGAAGPAPFAGGANTGGAPGDDGGAVFILGGDANAGTGGVVNVIGGTSATGGSVIVQAGDSDAVGIDGADVFVNGGSAVVGGSGDGGGVHLLGNSPLGTGTGGPITIIGGDGGVGGGDTAGGPVTITGGEGQGILAGGDVLITSGVTQSGTNTSRVLIAGGDNLASGVGSRVELEGGEGETGGLILVSGGDSSGGPGIGGGLTFFSGRSATGGQTGDILISVRPVPVSEASTGGKLTLQGGDTGTVGDGGDVDILAGNTNSLASVEGGDVNIQAGNSLTAGPGKGGDIILGTGQSSGSGVDGVVKILRGGLELNERISVFGPPITAGKGRLWLRDDSPNSLMFTDDVGTDIVISQIRNLANTMLIGNATGGTDLVLTAGDTMFPSTDGGANLGSTALRFGEVHVESLELENLRRSSGNRQTIGAVQSVVSGIYTLNSDGEAISVTIDIVGRSATLGSALSQQMLFSFFRNGTVQNLATVTNNTNYVGTVSTAKASLSINGLAIDLVFTGEASHTITWSANWEITHS